jgi:hypothetical protein
MTNGFASRILTTFESDFLFDDLPDGFEVVRVTVARGNRGKSEGVDPTGTPCDSFASSVGSEKEPWGGVIESSAIDCVTDFTVLHRYISRNRLRSS